MKNKSPLFLPVPRLWQAGIIHYSLYILIIITLFSCTTEPQTGTLSGNVQLQGETDHNSITVALYELSELDPDIVAINQEYPHIGVIINQHTEFDHRFANFTKYTQTDFNGNFKIKDIPTGRYNFMAMKDSFGFKYIYEVTITEGENELNSLKTKDQRPKIKETNLKPESDKNDFNLSYNFNLSSLLFSLNNSSVITLYPVTYISSDIDTATTWYSSHHYIIENDIFISGALTIEPGAIIRLNEGVKLTISGNLTAIGEEENMIWFTSNDSILHFTFYILHSPPKEDVTPYTFNRVELIGSLNKQVSFCKFNHAGTGLLSRVNGFSISDCIFRNSSCGFKSENVDSIFCSNLLCENITNESEGGIYICIVNSGIIERNILKNSKNGIFLYVESSQIIKNNYIKNCNDGIHLYYKCYPNILNNEMINNSNDISINGLCNPTIEYNNFTSDIGVNIPPTGMAGLSNSNIHNNNFYCIEFAIKILGTYWGSNAEDIHAEYNFWGTTDSNEIQNLIFDKNDLSIDNPNYPYTGYVLCDFPKHSKILGAGIKGD